MARRHIGGERRGFQINPIDFSRGGGGESKDDPAMAMAMAIMGYGKGTSPQDQALEAQKQAWAEKYQTGQLNIDELRQKAQEAEFKSQAEARTAATSDAAQRRMDEAAKEANRKAEEAGRLEYLTKKEERDADVEVFKNLVEHGGLTEKLPTGEKNPLYDLYAERAMPGITEKKEAASKAIFEQNVNAALNKYQAADPKKKAAIDKDPRGAGIPADIYSEMLNRMSAAQPGAPAAAPAGEGRLPLSRFAEQNVPTAPSSDELQLSHLIAPPVNAQDFSKFPGSVEDLIRASSNKPIPEQLVANRPVEAPTPQPNFYEEGYPSAKPDYMYGIQTPVAMDVINKYANDPRFTSVEDELMQKVKDWWNQPKAPEIPFPMQGVLQPNPGY